jgi:glucose/mannose-6-phosphate isomerase
LAQAARAEGVPVIPVAGGLQPRAAVAYMTVAALEVAAACGAGPRLTTEVDVAADHLEQLAIEWGPDSAEDSLAKSLARSIHGTIPVIAGYGLTEAVASRWKTQVNENANQLAFASVLPELDHNEIVGWGSAANFGRFSAVFFEDSDDPQRIARRIALTRSLIEADGASVHVVRSLGQTAVERAFSLILLGDLFSTYLAICNQQDPADIAVITALKKGLAEQE